MFKSTIIRLLNESLSRAYLQRIGPYQICSISSKTIQNNDLKLNPNFVNRNPRNLELLRIERKPKGYHLDAPTKSYYYKLNYELQKGVVSANITHFAGRVVLSVSSDEPYIKDKLYSASDASAALNIGRVLARRCIQSGILEVHTELKSQIESSERIRLFLNALEEGGVALSEPSQILEEDMYPISRKRPTLPWEVTEEEALDTRLDKSEDAHFNLPKDHKYE